MQTGNPYLKPIKYHNVNAMVMWKCIIAKTICAIFQNQMCKNRDFLHIFLASFSADFGRFLNAV